MQARSVLGCPKGTDGLGGSAGPEGPSLALAAQHSLSICTVAELMQALGFRDQVTCLGPGDSLPSRHTQVERLHKGGPSLRTGTSGVPDCPEDGGWRPQEPPLVGV